MKANAHPKTGRAPEVQGSDLDNQNPSATSDPTAKHTAARGVTLPEPIIVARFWRNRRGEAIAVSIEPYEGRVLVHVRQYFTDKAGTLAPTKKGVCVDVLRLPELAAAVNKALVRARELGLIDAEREP